MRTATKSLDLISTKKKLHVQHSFLYNPSPLFGTTTMPFCASKTWNFLVTHYFVYGEIVVRAHQNFGACVLLVRFYFLHCHSFSPCWPQESLIFSPPLRNFHVFFQQNLSPLFFISPSSPFSFINVNVDIENNLEKDSTLLLCFLSKSPGDHAVFR